MSLISYLMHIQSVILLIASLIGLIVFVAVSLLKMPPNLFMFHLLEKIFGEEDKGVEKDISRKFHRNVTLL